ncbi:translation elongation factor Ts [Candidatus Avoscillospira sp. LCP25S3_F1]|uniref:translation elongation factor Ts n=1 Tax=Candidatus Avoscillospira sp. LCP25S3_F1 TaxID=3438825 RepID=UPI003F926704
MAFTAQDVKKLREMTNVGMMDCKKALTASDGDMDKAVEWLREKGLAAAAKKSGRIAAEGVVNAVVENGVGAIVEINAETDFASKSDKFMEFVNDVTSVILKDAPADMDALKACKYPGSDLTVEATLPEKILVIGENIQIRRFARFDTGVTVAYTHMGGRIGVLVNMEVEGIAPDAVTELGKDICMQIASMNPSFRDKSDVAPEVLEKEKEIQLAVMANDPKMANKPEKVREGIVMGKLNKYYEENCLLQQAFVKENKISVEKHIEAVAKELGGSIKLVAFVRFEKGEGIEKKVDDFAAEVAAAAGLTK